MHGQPNLVSIFLNMNCIAVVVLQSFTGAASTHLVKYSVIVIIYLARVRFPGGLIGPTKSIAHLSNACNVICGFKGISFLHDGFPVLWQTSQLLQNSFASLWTVGHHSPVVRTFCTVSFPT